MTWRLLRLVKSRIFAVAILLLVCVAALLSSFSLPRTASLRTPDGTTQKVFLPISQPNGVTGSYLTTLTIAGGWLKQTRFHVIPDDDVIAVSVNGTAVDLTAIAPAARRNTVTGFHINLGPYLKHGKNRVTFNVLNTGGRYGIDVRPSTRDGNIRAHLVITSAALLTLLYLLLRKLRVAGRALDPVTVIATLLVLVLGVAVRYYTANEGTCDALEFVTWQTHIRTHGGLTALKDKFSAYPVSFEYLLYLGSLMPVPALHTLKLIYTCFELLGAVMAALLVRRRYPEELIFPWLAFVLVYLGPTVLLNGQMWGQCDIVFSSLGLTCLYLALRGKNWPAFALYGVALSFKLQAVFLGPFFLVLLVRREARLWHALATPIAYLLVQVPALLLGKRWTVIYDVYLEQSGTFPWLSAGLPNVYQWIPDARPELFVPLGLLLTLVAIIAVAMVAYHSREPRSEGLLVQAATVSSLLVPFLLPHMHERYFLFADLMTIVFAFYYPRYYFVPIVVGFLSFLSYGPFLLRFALPVPMPYMAIGMLAMLVTVVRQFVLSLFPDAGHSPHTTAQAARSAASSPDTIGSRAKTSLRAD